MRLFRILLILGFLIFSAGISWPEEPSQEASDKGYIFLTLDKALELALINNFDVQLALYDRWIKEADIDEELSIYDTVLKLTADHEYDKSKKVSSLSAKSSHTGSFDAELTKKLITGTDVTLSFENVRKSSDTTPAFTSLNPYYDSAAYMKFTQPLLRNFFGMEDWGEVKITKIDVAKYSSEVLDDIEESLADVEKAYWDVVIASELLDTGRDMFKRAEEFYLINKKKKELGTAELTDLFAAQANRDLRKTELEVEKDKLMTAMNKLKLLVNYPADESNILPISVIEIERKNPSFIQSLKTAFEKRRDYYRAKEEIKAKKIKFNIKRNARWPELDLEGSLRLNGVEKLYKSAAGAAYSDRNPVYYAKVTFSFPFEDRSAKSEYNKAKYEKAKALIDLKKVEKTIVTELDDVVRSVNVNKNRAQQLAEVEKIQKKKLAEELRLFGYGRSDSDKIIRFQEDFLGASIRALKAFRDYKHSLVELYLAQDTFLEERGLAVE